MADEVSALSRLSMARSRRVKPELRPKIVVSGSARRPGRVCVLLHTEHHNVYFIFIAVFFHIRHGWYRLLPFCMIFISTYFSFCITIGRMISLSLILLWTFVVTLPEIYWETRNVISNITHLPEYNDSSTYTLVFEHFTWIWPPYHTLILKISSRAWFLKLASILSNTCMISSFSLNSCLYARFHSYHYGRL